MSKNERPTGGNFLTGSLETKGFKIILDEYKWLKLI